MWLKRLFAVPEKCQIDMVIHFDFDSTQLQAKSKPLLTNHGPDNGGLKDHGRGHRRGRGRPAQGLTLPVHRDSGLDGAGGGVGGGLACS